MPVYMIIPAPGRCGDRCQVEAIAATPKERDAALRRARGSSIAVEVEENWYSAGEWLVSADWHTSASILDAAWWFSHGKVQHGQREAPHEPRQIQPGEIGDRMSRINEDEARGFITRAQAAEYRRRLT